MFATERENAAFFRLQRGRARRMLGQLWQIPLFLIGVLAFAAVAITSPLRTPVELNRAESALTRLREALESDAGADSLVKCADDVVANLLAVEREISVETHLLLAAAYARKAETNPTGQKDLWRQVAKHAEAVDSPRTPKAIVARSRFLFANAQYYLGENLRRVAELWDETIETQAPDKAAAYAKLVALWQRSDINELDRALSANQRWLEAVPAGDIDGQTAVRLRTVEMLLTKQAWVDAVRESDRVSASASPILRLKAILMKARANEEALRWPQAAEAWRAAISLSDVAGGAGKLWYAIGRCYRQASPINVEEAEKAWREAMAKGGAEGRAAALRLGELKFFVAPSNPSDALAAWKDGMKGVRGPLDLPSELVTPETVREWFDRALVELREQERFEQMAELAEAYQPIALPGVAEEKLARAREGVAAALQAKADAEEDETVTAQAEEAHAKAGQALAGAAKTKTGRERTDLLWRGALEYLAAKQPSEAALLLDHFVQTDRDETRLAKGWFMLGEAYAEQKKTDLASEAYFKSIEFPKTPFAFKARYKIALLEIEKNRLEDAQAILQQNLNITPPLDAASHEKSIYKLAWLLYVRERFDEAGIYYKIAIDQYPANSEASSARYYLADSYRKLAEQARTREFDLLKKSRSGAGAKMVDEGAINHQKQTKLAWFEKSRHVARLLADDLESKVVAGQATKVESVVFRRALLAIAECSFERGEYGDAIQQFLSVQTRARKSVEGLIATTKLWNVRKVLGNSEEFREQIAFAMQTSLDRAHEDLKAMPDDAEAFPNVKGVWTRAEWMSWVSLSLRELTQPKAPATKNETLFK